jgi:photosystem II stability/assembly factor-like uncharacterized protein
MYQVRALLPKQKTGDHIKMTKLLTFLFVAALAIAPALYGQDAQAPSQQRPGQGQSQQADRAAGEDTMTGCLTESAGTYRLSTTGGQSVDIEPGTQDLTKHKDHTVRITGKKSDEGGKTKVTVSKIEHVSATCTK